MLNKGLLWGLAAYLAVVWDTTTPSPWAPCAAVIWVLQFSLCYPQHAVWGGALLGLLSDAGQHALIGPGVVAGGVIGWGMATGMGTRHSVRGAAYGVTSLAGAAVWQWLPVLGHWASTVAEIEAGQGLGWSAVLLREGGGVLITGLIGWALARQVSEPARS